MSGQPPPPPSKLFIRSEVLAVIEYLSVVEVPSKQERGKQIKRLASIEDRESVLGILMKELQRANAGSNLHAVTELLMELGDINTLQDPLWAMIRANDTRDEIKDAANLILRHLGDEADPDLYLEYLEDPQGLINRETERMLEVAARNPEALIDFIDFIFSLPIGEQINLLASLQTDYDPEHLLNIYIPTLLADPPPEVKELLLKGLAQIPSKRCALFLFDIQGDYDEASVSGKLIQKAVKTLRLAGIYREELMDEYRKELDVPHPILEDSKIDRCFVTLTDGIGNQGIVMSRRQTNGDMMMMSVAVNDLHGIIDCFGFFQLSEADFNKIADKFHEESAKIEATPGYCKAKLEAAEGMTRENRGRIPYEYTCWKTILGDVAPVPVDTMTLCGEIAKPDWHTECHKLYRHPDFATWFLEEGDHPVVTEILTDVTHMALKAAENQIPLAQFLDQADRYAYGMSLALMTTEWKQILVARLADAAYLLRQQEANTFATLAATEAVKLANVTEAEEERAVAVGFVRQFGKRCIEEHLLRLKHDPNLAFAIAPYVDGVIAAWDVGE